MISDREPMTPSDKEPEAACNFNDQNQSSHITSENQDYFSSEIPSNYHPVQSFAIDVKQNSNISKIQVHSAPIPKKPFFKSTNHGKIQQIRNTAGRIVNYG